MKVQDLRHLPADVIKPIKAYHRSKRTLLVLRALVFSAIVYLSLFLIASHIDRFLFLDFSTRLLMSRAAHVLSLLVLVGSLGWAFMRQWSINDLLHSLEHRIPQETFESYVTLNDVLAKENDREKGSTAGHIAHLENFTLELSRQISGGRLAQDLWFKRLLKVLVVFGILLGLLAVPKNYQLPLMAKRFVYPQVNDAKPSFIRLKVTPEALVVGKGEDIVLQSEVSGTMPDFLRWLLVQAGMPQKSLIAIVDGKSENISFDSSPQFAMSRVQKSLYVFTRSELDKGFSFKIRYLDAETVTHHVRVVPQPRLKQMWVKATPPEYTGMKEVKIDNVKKPLKFLDGTQIQLGFTADQELEEITLVEEGEREPREIDWDDESLEGLYEFTLKKKILLEIRLKNSDGFSNKEKYRVAISILPDRQPVVQLKQPLADMEMVPSEYVDIVADIEDDLGISEVAIRYLLNPDLNADASPKEDLLTLEKAGAKKLQVRDSFDLGKSGAVPGDTVLVQLRARDSGGNDGLSREVFIKVVPFTRGENERIRLLGFNFFKGCADAIVSDLKKRKSQQYFYTQAFGGDSSDRINKLAKNINFFKTVSLENFFTFLEREHYFTDSALHKREMRLITGYFQHLLEKARTSQNKSLDADIKTFSEILARISQYRRIKNLLWRYYGMRKEVGLLRAKIQAELKKEKKDKGAQKSLKRRGELFSKTVQALNSELLRLAKELKSINAKDLQLQIRKTNSAAYYMKRGSLKKRISQSKIVDTNISDLIKQLKKVSPKIFSEYLKAHEKLKAQHEAQYKEVVSQVSKTKEYGFVHKWLGTQLQLLDRNPLSGLDIRWRYYAPLLSKQGESLSAESRKAFDRSGLARRLDWELERIADLKVDQDERDLESSITHIEISMATSGSDARKIFAQVEEIASGKILKAKTIDWQADATHKARADLTRAFNQTLKAKNILGQIQNYIKWQETQQQRMLKKMVEVKKLEPEKVLGGINEVENLLHEALFQQNLFISTMHFQLSLSGLSEKETFDELLSLQCRKSFWRLQRKLDRAMIPLVEARGKAVDRRTKNMIELSADKVVRLHASMIRTMKKLVTESSKDKKAFTEKYAEQYLIIRDYRRSRNFISSCDILPQKDKAMKVVSSLLKSDKQSLQFFLSSHVGTAMTLKDEFNRFLALIKTSKDRSKAKPHWDRSIGAAQDLVTQLKHLPEEESYTELKESIRSIKDQINSAKPVFDKSTNAEKLNRHLFLLEKVAKKIRRFEGDLKGDLLEFDASSILTGGPVSIYDKSYKNDISRTRKRVLRQLRWFQLRIVNDFFKVFDEKAKSQPEVLRNWSFHLHGFVRSKLYGYGAIERQSTDTTTQKNPLIAFLKAELEKARKVKKLKNYAPETFFYLKLVNDFLRY